MGTAFIRVLSIGRPNQSEPLRQTQGDHGIEIFRASGRRELRATGLGKDRLPNGRSKWIGGSKHGLRRQQGYKNV